MRVTLRYLSQVRRLLGRSEETLDLPPGATLVDALRQVAGPLVTAEGRPSPSLLFFVDDVAAGPDAPLVDGSCVTVLAPMAGGS